MFSFSRSGIRSNVTAGGVLGEDSSGLAPDYKGLPAPICHTVKLIIGDHVECGRHGSGGARVS